ncbi:TPM domain-containing protein [Leptospira terpstrae]|uniref:PF04536 family protein n=1 Tax=Leptospira terpstrae serovar Hualin str. LT 11-33 = ATCC 700639 TaxID=1257025 RepID=N1VUW9_9LEPT|nr:PF04536 family protein [Leptospira terpstrae serovar Hualin str. LT 11-33 = ATCC 700639]
MNSKLKFINSKFNFKLPKGWLFVLVLLQFLTGLSSFPVPQLERRVMDHAGILSEATITKLESDLKQFEADTSNQIAVYTTPSLHEENIEEVAIEIFDEWKLGQKNKNNGVLLLIAPNERKMRIEVGRGLEGALTDIQAKQIIRNEIRPSFKSGDMDGGVTAGVNSIMAAIRGEYAPSEDDVATNRDNSFSDVAPSGLVGGIFTFISMFIPAFGGLVFTIVGLFVLYPLLVFIFGGTAALFVAIFLFILVMILKRIFGFGQGGGGSGGGFYSGGGWSSGGDSWSSGGTDSWSGGGGDSAGGGASGDW